MAKRPADVALAWRDDEGEGVSLSCKHSRPSPGNGEGIVANAGAPKPSPNDGGAPTRTLPHRVRSVSSSASSSSELSRPATETNKSMPPRTVSSLSGGSIDGDVPTVAGQKRGRDGQVPTSAGQLTRFVNARLLQRDGTLVAGTLTVDVSASLIVAVGLLDKEHDENCGDAVHVVDCQGHILSPGFVDIQLNGAYGVDFSNDGGSGTGLSAEDVLRVARRLVETGVTSFCPTMISSTRQTYRRILPILRKAREQQQQNGSNNDEERGANILGMHLEGPFFAASKRGAHDLQHISNPDKGISSVEDVYGLRKHSVGNEMQGMEDIDIVTLAPELPGALEAIQSLTSNNTHNVAVSCGHTEASYEDGIQALSNGATLLTHLYNAMNPFHHRNPGLMGLLSSQAKLEGMGLNRPFFSIICDGMHVHESAVAMAYRSHPDGCVLVTDAMAGQGLGDGTHSLGNMSVSIKGDRATIYGTDTLAGSVVSMDTCVKRFRAFAGCSIGEALLCSTLHPAVVLKRHAQNEASGIGRDAPIGILEAGARADLVLVNDELDVLSTWLGGHRVFRRKS
ncbi:hypothetical protein ACHAXT_002262 [Thalassiosira profunda]